MPVTFFGDADAWRKPVGEAAQPADPELERLERLLVLDAAAGPGGWIAAQRGDVLLLALGEAVQLRARAR